MANTYKHLGQLGIEQLLQLMAAEFAKVQYEEAGKGLSTNDFTNALLEKLNGIEEGANKYTHAAHTAHALGLYQVQVDEEGHVVAIKAVEKGDITALGIPGQDTTYVVATADADGLMSKADFSKLAGIEAGANKYVHATHGAYESGIYKITVDTEGHVTGATAVTKADLDGIIKAATQAEAGLLSAEDKAKIDALGALASKSLVSEADLDDELKQKVNAAAEGNHAHLNKELLDTYTQTEENLADAVAKKHAHANAEELDKIASGDKAKWDKAVEDLAGEITRAKAAEEANAKAASDAATAASTADGKAVAAQSAADLNKTAIQTLNGDENTAGSVAKTVKDYVAGKIASAYKAGGSKAYEELPEPSADVEGYVYNMTNDFTTDADFVEGAGNQYKAGTNVVIVEADDGSYKYDVLAMSFDGFVQEANITEYSADEITTMWNSVFTA